MEGKSKKKRFVYKALATKEFPRDLDQLLSQPTKKKKLNDGSTKSAQTSETNLLAGVEMEDDLDLCMAADEINKIEIAASQQFVSKRTHATEMIDKEDSVLDELLSNNFVFEVTKEPCLTPIKNPNMLSLKLPVAKSSTKSETFTNQSTKSVAKTLQCISPIKPAATKTFPFPAPQTSLKHQANTRKQLTETKEELEIFKTKLKEAEKRHNTKDGEIKILRESMRKLSEKEHSLKETVQKMESELKTQQSEKEQSLAKEVERLKTDLNFKRKEVLDMVEKHKLMAAVIKNPPPDSRSPKVGFSCEGFSKSKIPKTFPAKNILSPPAASEKLTRRNKKFSDILKESQRCFLTPYNLILQNTIDKRPTNCQTLTLYCKHNITTTLSIPCITSELQSYLLLLDTTENCALDFIKMLSRHISKCVDILGQSVNCTDQRNSICLNCQQIYNNGVKAIFVLGEACLHHRSVRCAFLNGLKDDETLKNEELSAKTQRQYTLDDIVYSYKFPNECTVVVDRLSNCTLNDSSDNPVQLNNTAQCIWQSLKQIYRFTEVNLNDLKEEMIVLYTKFSTPINIDSFVAFLIDEHIVSDYLHDASLRNISTGIQLLQNCIHCSNICDLLCNSSDRCPLLTIVTSFGSNPNGAIFKEFVALLSSIFSLNRSKAVDVLLEKDCRCATETHEQLVEYLFKEVMALRMEVSPQEANCLVRQRLTVFRQGITLLSILMSTDRTLIDRHSPVEWNYLYLLHATISLFRSIPDISESEVLVLEDLEEQYMEEYGGETA